MKPYERTYWRYSPPAVEQGKSRKVVLAVQQAMDVNGETHLIAWELELRPAGIDHPYYGIIPYEYCQEYDMFPDPKPGAYPKAEFTPNDEDYFPIGTSLDKVLSLR